MQRKMAVSLNCPAESCEQCGVRRPCFPNRNLISPWPSVWHPLFLDKVFWCPHGNESNFLLPCPSKTFLGTSDSMRPSLSSALERYKYPGTVPGTFRRGLGFIFYLVALRETCQGDQAERGVLLVKPLSQVKDWAFFFICLFFFFHSIILVWRGVLKWQWASFLRVYWGYWQAKGQRLLCHFVKEQTAIPTALLVPRGACLFSFLIGIMPMDVQVQHCSGVLECGGCCPTPRLPDFSEMLAGLLAMLQVWKLQSDLSCSPFKAALETGCQQHSNIWRGWCNSFLIKMLLSLFPL